MNCEDCDHRVFDHHVPGSPRGVYTCGHPDGLTDEGDCWLEQPDPIRDQHRNCIGMILEWVVNDDPILVKLTLNDADVYIWDQLAEYFTHK